MGISQITLHEYQKKAWFSKKRFIYFTAGVQSGKTTFGAVWIINEANNRGPGDYLIMAPTYRILDQSTLQKFFEIAPPGWGRHNKAESTYRTVTGQTFFLRSAENPEAIEGITAKAIWADEASMMKAESWVMMQGRVSRTGGRILCTFTPVALNWIHREIEKDKQLRMQGIETDIDYIQFRSVDSPYFPKEEYERAKRMLTPAQFSLRYEGIFGKAEGLIYPDFGPDNIVDDFEVPNEWRKIGGLDFGFNNPFVALHGAVNNDDVLFIYQEYYKNRGLLKEHQPRLVTDITYAADPSGLQEIMELRYMGFTIQAANNDVGVGIMKVNERIRTGRLKVFKSCLRTIDEFSLYRYETGMDKSILKEKPLKQEDHCMDALRYLVMALARPSAQVVWI